MDLKSTLKTSNKYISTLNLNGIQDLKDFFQYLPRTYEDRTSIKKISELTTENNIQAVKGKILKKDVIKTPRGKRLIQISFEDEEGKKGSINLMNNPYLLKTIQKDKWYIIIGKPKVEYGKISFRHPEIEESQESDSFKVKRIFPIYPELEGIKPNRFAKKIWENLGKIDEVFQERLPSEIIKEFNLLKIEKAIKNLHFPESFELLDNAKFRYYFDKLLNIQLISLLNKENYKENFEKENKISQPNRDIIKEILEKLSFTLTNAQKKSLKDIIDDFHKTQPMLRLLQGDVGSGKTIVAIIAVYYMKKYFNSQSAFLAPTEVLAQQHFKNLSKILLPLGVNMQLLTGSTTKKQKEKVKDDLSQGKIDLIVGTHAIIQENIDFYNLGFSIVDEQQKFGVKQRSFFKKFGSPHILQMTATPIPRSMALAFFGEFEVSTINEMPQGRKDIYTRVISEQEFEKIKQWVLTKINQGQKVYIVTPLIEESEYFDEVSSATQEYEYIKDLFGEISDKVGLLHGNMKQQEKDEAMKNFQEGKTNILVSTTVIEVGVDVSEATIIVIKSPERFGLAQLHQLRGRVGRSNIQSYCFLVTNSSGTSVKRLKNMEKYGNGFKLAEIDMQERGSGEILGIRQSGDTDVPHHILTNTEFLEKVQKAALEIIKNYPNLKGLDSLKNELKEKDNKILI